MFNDNGNRIWSLLNRRRRLVIWMTRRGMLRVGIVAGLLMLTGTIFLSEIPTSNTWTHWTLPLSGKVIALDAGHGGADGGAVSSEGIIEKDLNLAIVLYLRDYLQQAGALVQLTREGDYDLATPETKGYSRRKTEDLLQRADRVHKQQANLTISIHMNSMPSPRWSGAQTFYSPRNTESKRLATVIQSEIRNILGNTQRIAKRADTIYLLKTLEMPTALVEVGFLSHPEEANLLADEQYQRKVAAAIYRGVLRYASGEVGEPVL
ncbi:N-acetylmuramoyl-L-alanine amidase CwlD [Cohnella sp. NL03-T5]|uniref:N-acetylmuramoyl-L-alanine amidase CwlD n=2 Tax=Cohnella silvisoli TaxID=2873699 RepID=A0ABV1L3U8_9BACL|nr:N-acetylmuramoyl-L-alanine amidase CwlD [Cohnella silvisoli]MCD9026396.1 N-acetylmuramoyl-L-alanine amidase CwlD [Cohnella silvisoli]